MFAKRRFGESVEPPARAIIGDQRPYPSASVIRNPLTRAVARRIAESDWRATLSQIDFPYTANVREVGGVACLVLRSGTPEPSAPVVIYVHAGGFVSGSARANAAAALPACRLAGCEVIAVEYSLAPEDVFPTQLEEIDRVYRGLLNEGRKPGQIVLVGDSAGGTLVVGSLYRWRRLGAPMPAGAALLSPALDARAQSDTIVTLRRIDPLFVSSGKSSYEDCFRIYAGDAAIDDPEVSPLAGDPSGLPPLLIHAGTREILLGDAARFAEKARRAGVDASLHVFDGMFHLFHQHWSLAAAKTAHQDIADFIMRVAR